MKTKTAEMIGDDEIVEVIKELMVSAKNWRDYLRHLQQAQVSIMTSDLDQVEAAIKKAEGL